MNYLQAPTLQTVDISTKAAGYDCKSIFYQCFDFFFQKEKKKTGHTSILTKKKKKTTKNQKERKKKRTLMIINMSMIDSI